MSPRDEEQLLRWAISEICRGQVRRLAAAVAQPGVRLVAIKGVHIAALTGPGERPMNDVDVVVAAGSFADVVERAVRSGEFRIRSDDWSTKTLEHRNGGPPVDVHRLPLPPLFGAMSTAALLEHAVPAEGLGASVLFPDPADAAVISLVNIFKDVFGYFGRYHLHHDLDALAAAGLTPAALAERLRLYRLRRIGILTLRELTRRDERYRPWLDACAPTPADELTADRLERLMRKAAPLGHNVALLAARLVGDRPLDVVASGGFGAARLFRDGTRALWARVR